ncbi:calpain 7 [Balamuthia mandrillaris]
MSDTKSWLWQGYDGTWLEVPASIVALLEQALLLNEPGIMIDHERYVDLVNMKWWKVGEEDSQQRDIINVAAVPPSPSSSSSSSSSSSAAAATTTTTTTTNTSVFSTSELAALFPQLPPSLLASELRRCNAHNDPPDLLFSRLLEAAAETTTNRQTTSSSSSSLTDETRKLSEKEEENEEQSDGIISISVVGKRHRAEVAVGTKEKEKEKEEDTEGEVMIPSEKRTRQNGRERTEWMVATNEEEQVMLESSIIRDRVFVPWNLRDLESEIFYLPPSQHFLDPDGMLALTKEQEERFVAWRRPHQFLSDPKMLLGERLSYYSITQSVIGDCSFLASLCVATNYEKRTELALVGQNCYPQDERGIPTYNPSGKYVFRMFWNGVARKVVIDDLLPLDRFNNPICSFSNNRSELLVSMLEKAYMKVRGGYSNGSNAASDMHILFGWIPETFSFGGRARKDRYYLDVFWTRIFTGFRDDDCMIVFSTADISPEEDFLAEGENESSSTRRRGQSIVNNNHLGKRTGLLTYHAYACLDVRCVQGHRLLKLKNPWSSHRWKGKWSLFDVDSWTPSMQKELEYDLQNDHLYDNGVFWIDFESVAKYFAQVSLAWKPRYSHQKVVHGRLTANENMSKEDAHASSSDSFIISVDPATYESSPQYLLRLKAASYTSVLIVLLRHQLAGNSKEFTERRWRREERDWLKLNVYANGGQRVVDGSLDHDREVLVHDGHFLQANEILARIDVTPGIHNFTIMLCHQLLSNSFNYTLKIYSDEPIAELSLIPPREVLFKALQTGEWSREQGTAAGSCNYHNFLANPKYLLRVKPLMDIASSSSLPPTIIQCKLSLTSSPSTSTSFGEPICINLTLYSLDDTFFLTSSTSSSFQTAFSFAHMVNSMTLASSSGNYLFVFSLQSLFSFPALVVSFFLPSFRLTRIHVFFISL